MSSFHLGAVITEKCHSLEVIDGNGIRFWPALLHALIILMAAWVLNYDHLSPIGLRITSITYRFKRVSANVLQGSRKERRGWWGERGWGGAVNSRWSLCITWSAASPKIKYNKIKLNILNIYYTILWFAGPSTWSIFSPWKTFRTDGIIVPSQSKYIVAPLNNTQPV